MPVITDIAFQMILNAAMYSISQRSCKVTENAHNILQPKLFSDVDILDPPYKPMCIAIPKEMVQQNKHYNLRSTSHKLRNDVKK